MSWEKISSKHLPELIHFLLPFEYRAVSFTSRLKNTLFTHPGERKHACFVYREDNSGHIISAVLVTPAGLYLPVFTDKYPSSFLIDETFRREVSNFTGKIHSFIGTEQDVLLLEKILRAHPKNTIHYRLMTLETQTPLNHKQYLVQNEIVIRKAQKKDAPKLFPLQKGYELEEVIIKSEHFRDKICMNFLRYNIRNQIIFFASCKDIPIAKAGTNGLGFDYCQLGGVYTLPEFRNKGISTSLVAFLTDFIIREKKKITLFVKESNIPALRVYNKLNYQPRCGYKVSYFF